MNRSYISEASMFINVLKKNNPHLESLQLEGRALLWDKPFNLSNVPHSLNTSNRSTPVKNW